MPTLSATDGATASPVEQIKRVDINAEDIRKMSNEELEQALALLRRNRETPAPRKGGSGAKRSSIPNEQLIDDSDIDGSI